MRTSNMSQVASLRTGTVHIAATTSGAVACRPNSQTDGEWTDVQANCKSCLRIIARAEELAYALLAAVRDGEAEAERHMAFDIEHSRLAVFNSVAHLRQVLPLRRDMAQRAFNGDDLETLSDAAYSLRRGELELAHLEQLAAQAELEAHKINPSNAVFEIGLGADLKLHTRVMPPSSSGQFIHP